MIWLGQIEFCPSVELKDVFRWLGSVLNKPNIYFWFRASRATLIKKTTSGLISAWINFTSKRVTVGIQQEGLPVQTHLLKNWRARFKGGRSRFAFFSSTVKQDLVKWAAATKLLGFQAAADQKDRAVLGVKQSPGSGVSGLTTTGAAVTSNHSLMPLLLCWHSTLYCTGGLSNDYFCEMAVTQWSINL